MRRFELPKAVWFLLGLLGTAVTLTPLVRREIRLGAEMDYLESLDKSDAF